MIILYPRRRDTGKGSTRFGTYSAVLDRCSISDVIIRMMIVHSLTMHALALPCTLDSYL